MTQGLTTRVLEPEVMDAPGEADEYDTMDHSEVNRRFVADFLATQPRLTRVLDLGTGTALIPIVLCQSAPQARVEAADAAESMLTLGRRNVEAAGLSQSIQLTLIDAKGLPFADGSFSAVMSNSLIHHLPDARPALAEAVRVAAPGAVLFFRDLFRPNGEEELARLVALYAGDATDRQRELFADSLRAAYTVAEMQTLVAELGFDRESVQATSDRHWTWVAQKSGG